MSRPNTIESLVKDFSELGLESGATVMVHAALGKVGWTVGGPVAVIRALLHVLGSDGTLVMPCETPSLLDPAMLNDERVKPQWHDTIREHLPVFDPDTTPTTMGAIAEAFRTFPGTLRSHHPLVSVCAHGAQAPEITREHALEFAEGAHTPFEKLYTLGSQTLLLGVGFNRCTSLHYAESQVANRRTIVHRIPIMQRGERVWIDTTDMGHDDGVHFPVVGEQFVATGAVRAGCVGGAESMLFSTRAIVNFAQVYFARELA